MQTLTNPNSAEIVVNKGSGSDFVQTFKAYAGERTIIVPKGHYLCTEKLPVVPGTHVKGVAAYYDSQGSATVDANILAGTVKGTVIELGFDGDLFEAASEARGCIFEDFYCYGKGENSGVRAFHWHGNGFIGSFKSSIWRGVKLGVWNKAAIRLGKAGATALYDNVIEDLQAYWCGCGATTTEYSGIVIDEGCSDLKVDRGTISNCGHAAFEVLAAGGGNHRLSGLTLQLSSYGAYARSTINFDSCSIDQNQLDAIVLSGNIGTDGSSSIVGCKIRKSGLATNDTYFHIRLIGTKGTRIIAPYFRMGAANKAKACIGWDNTGALDCRYIALGADAYLGANTLTNLGWDIVGGHTEKEANSVEEHNLVA